MAGRIGRKAFWKMWGCLVGTLFFLAIALALLVQVGPAGRMAGNVIALPVLLLLAWLSIANQVKRWHDLGRSGWMIFISLIPFVGFVANVVCLGFLRGQPGSNRFGAEPGQSSLPVSPAAESAPPPVIPVVAPAAPPPVAAPRSRGRRLVLVMVVVVLVVMPLLAGLLYVAMPGEKLAAQRDWVRAILGSAEASHRLGWRYRNGEGEPQNFRTAAEWFERAARKGLPRAQYDAGVLHFYGLGVPADSGVAVSWLEQAAAQGYAPARTLLGVIAAQSGDTGRAMASWQSAADLGDSWAESLLGSAYLAQRDGSDENLILALYWMETARRDGVEPVVGQLQHVWATVPEDRLETVTTEVFRRIEAGSPAPLALALPAAVVPVPEAVPGTPSPDLPVEVATAPDPLSAGVEELSAAVLDRVEQLEEYVALKSMFDQRNQADPAWANSEDGQTVTAFIDAMLADAEAVHVARADDGTETLAYAIQGAGLNYTGVQIDRLKTDGKYQRLVTDELARNIVSVPKPLRIAELLRAYQEEKEGTAK